MAVGQQDSIHRIAECGWLHNKIKQFISRARNDRSAGTIVQSFASGLHEHLTEYYRLVATLEVSVFIDIFIYSWWLIFLTYLIDSYI